jgi:2-polyprenyl-6-hydroxyphenyl methylase/3-demethylubiquinone-9 3-methyltransferase
MHVINLFITPNELRDYCQQSGLEVLSMVGIRPKISTITWKMMRTGIVSEKMAFTLTKNTTLSYMGVGRKL